MHIDDQMKSLPPILELQPISQIDPKDLWDPEEEPTSSGEVHFVSDSSDLYEILERVFRLEEFREMQLDIITSSLDGGDIFVLMPTGGGKSLCYQLPAVYQNKKHKAVTVVVSPLVALIHDQVVGLKKKGIRAEGITSDTDFTTREKIMQNVAQGKVALLYVTPELLQKSRRMSNVLTDVCSAQRLERFVIDEAHCATLWEYRSAYRDLRSVLRDGFPDVPITALTATPADIDGIIRHLGMENVKMFRQSLNRDNISYNVKPALAPGDMAAEIVRFIRSCGHKDNAVTGIIYCTRKKKCEKLAEQLREKFKIRAGHYHADLSPADKKKVYDRWQNGQCTVIVATTAFGLGIDKKDVRFVVHYNTPQSLENYFQETGRAGRDGHPADCICYYSYMDLERTSTKFANNVPDAVDRMHKKNAAAAMADFCDEQSTCRKVLLLRYFGEKFDATKCNRRCDNCSCKFVRRDLTAEAVMALSFVHSLRNLPPRHRNITALQCIEVLRGVSLRVRDQEVLKRRQNDRLYGSWNLLSRNVAALIFDRLLSRRALVQKPVSSIRDPNRMNFYVELGPRAEDLLNGVEMLHIAFPPEKENDLDLNDLKTAESGLWETFQFPDGGFFTFSDSAEEQDKEEDDTNGVDIGEQDEEEEYFEDFEDKDEKKDFEEFEDEDEKEDFGELEDEDEKEDFDEELEDEMMICEIAESAD